MIQTIATKIHEAAGDGNKIAMFHFQILLHAHELAAMDPVDFCRLVKVPDSYATEFRKMLSLARLMREEGVALTLPT
jgi:hypothetical protein